MFAFMVYKVSRLMKTLFATCHGGKTEREI